MPWCSRFPFFWVDSRTCSSKQKKKRAFVEVDEKGARLHTRTKVSIFSSVLLSINDLVSFSHISCQVLSGKHLSEKTEVEIQTPKNSLGKKDKVLYWTIHSKVCLSTIALIFPKHQTSNLNTPSIWWSLILVTNKHRMRTPSRNTTLLRIKNL